MVVEVPAERCQLQESAEDQVEGVVEDWRIPAMATAAEVELLVEH